MYGTSTGLFQITIIILAVRDGSKKRLIELPIRIGRGKNKNMVLQHFDLPETHFKANF